MAKFEPLHVFSDGRVTPERVAAFANAPTKIQLAALTRLRGLSAPRLADLAAIAALVTTLVVGGGALWVALGGLSEAEGNLYVDPRTGKTAGFKEVFGGAYPALAWLVVVFLAAVLVWIWMRMISNRAIRCGVLLAAYLDELSLRRSSLDPAGDAWRTRHPIDWAGEGNSARERTRGTGLVIVGLLIVMAFALLVVIILVPWATVDVIGAPLRVRAGSGAL
ncbi:hypothetical protein [Mesorhizobium japonicum]|uniref:hypothetical protein n=1 Tax=Mesorhizobium japonicum TaxID=2066070 RepID=UPI003B5B5763